MRYWGNKNGRNSGRVSYFEEMWGLSLDPGEGGAVLILETMTMV
jgi:hypothetical protein